MTVGGGSQNKNFTHPRAEWFEIKMNINIDEDLAILSLDGEELTHWAWSEGSKNQTPTKHAGLAGLCFISAAKDGSDAHFFIDDVSFSELKSNSVDLD